MTEGMVLQGARAVCSQPQEKRQGSWTHCREEGKCGSSLLRAPKSLSWTPMQRQWWPWPCTLQRRSLHQHLNICISTCALCPPTRPCYGHMLITEHGDGWGNTSCCKHSSSNILTYFYNALGTDIITFKNK